MSLYEAKAAGAVFYPTSSPHADIIMYSIIISSDSTFRNEMLFRISSTLLTVFQYLGPLICISISPVSFCTDLPQISGFGNDRYSTQSYVDALRREHHHVEELGQFRLSLQKLWRLGRSYLAASCLTQIGGTWGHWSCAKRGLRDMWIRYL